ncbi:hypothetical protein Prede_1887 [Prevotella dentalis DSM 3688]|uniref:Uncharacterized protein n=1 Tax=Prevotella dentalis (strain ATCC 49559 / DSM 3688 / JCM 13448 / NCTC 12043 / ES 2772) TaxID=908937 RepID=F9D5D5_PREDD|nr:hypothetical protein [Prevotella dentalis]AGB29169.1 hypothetical protein Prede_1887 [Prevotella dentalis DSM 3688]EGQ13245.1 hypothetical protein HMPREF9136_2063 [Prevotella dentalis DSM 3688]
MNVIEQCLIGKHTPEDCEDGIVLTPHFAAVIDGSTSKSPSRVRPDMRNGRYAMLLVADFIRRMPADASLADCCLSLTAQLRAHYPESPGGPEAIPPHERLCASAVIFSRVHREVWMVGDCQCMVADRFFDNPKPGEAALAARRAACFHQCYYDEDHMLDGMNIVHDYARDMILPDLIRSMQQQNVAYAVIDGTPIHMPGVRTIPVPEPPTEVVLASDGYPQLCPTLAESEAALRRQLDDDPFCIRTFKATKGRMVGNQSFDDRAYLRLGV